MEGSALMPLPEMIPGLVGPAVGGILVVSLCLHRNNEDAHCPNRWAGGTRPRLEKNDYGTPELQIVNFNVKRSVAWMMESIAKIVETQGGNAQQLPEHKH